MNLDEGVLNTMRSVHFWPLFTPASLTYLLQPLDVFAFSPLKHRLAAASQRIRRETPGGRLPVVQWAEALFESVEEKVMSVHWPRVFSRTGSRNPQRC